MPRIYPHRYIFIFMRIGILTFHRAHNYGAVLQCYALQEVLKSMGHEVSVIDYQSKTLLNCYKVFDYHRFCKKNLAKVIKEIRLLSARRKRSNGFNLFISRCLNTVPVESIMETPFDFIIVGSDQVWNFNLTKGFDNYYWGLFKHPTSTKLLSYAASMEEIWSKEDEPKLRSCLNNFSAISVREESLKLKLSTICTDKEITMVVDPTLLIDTVVWDRIAKKPSIAEPYLLLYQVRNNQKCHDIATKIAKEKGLRLIALSAAVNKLNSKEAVGASPEEFLGWFKYASFVVCASFHGTVFSLVFQRPFYSIRLNDGKDSRVLNLMEKTGTLDKFIDDCPQDTDYEMYDTNMIRHTVKTMAESSMNYLKTNL